MIMRPLAVRWGHGVATGTIDPCPDGGAPPGGGAAAVCGAVERGGGRAPDGGQRHLGDALEAAPGARRGADRGLAAPGLAPHKKGALRAGWAVASLDELGHTFRARVGTTRAPVGRPPVLRRVSQRREVSSLAALVAPPGGPARLYA